MTDYPTTWWAWTGDYSPSVDGVSSRIYRNVATGELKSSRELPVGALWALDRKFYSADDKTEPPPDAFPACGSDGLSIACNCLGGHHWYIDGKASNCTMKDDHKHRCWVRHGTVGEKLTVDKNGQTCKAGAGSFYMGYDHKTGNHSWHGFLENGVMVQR